ncbi:uncharacterized protein H6S33_001594 [Morchella sextelata]|uniref:uncharacterized protein n=1 Tax=Morchella sextelata TaxID=1174677 RepID=UPI001D051B65|nr:uncharacterized protein H6S33_001594 [Morchella sextelata]KAH0608460.1 hypothetical protein H6S33_001594 [Morchella sextelata]
MPRVHRYAASTSTSTSSSSPTPNLNVSVIHLSVAKKLAAGRSYTGIPPLGPLVLPPYISYDIVDDSPGLPLETKPDELYATVGGPGEPRLKKIKLIADCEEGEKWKEAAERFQGGNKQGTMPAAYIKVEEEEEEEEEEADQDIKKLKRYGSLRGAVTNSKTKNDSNETKKRKIKNDSNETKRRRIKKNSPAVSNLPPDFVLPDLTPEEAQPRRAEATLKNEALKRGLGLKSLSFHHSETVDKRGLGLESSSFHHAEMVDKGTQTHTQAVLTVPRKIVEFTERLVRFLRILRKAIEVLPESHLVQIEAYFEVDWMVEDIEIAIKGTISRKNLADGAKKGYKGLIVADRLPFSKNQKIIEFAERLMSLVKTLYQAIEMLKDIRRIVKGVISCKAVHDASK